MNPLSKYLLNIMMGLAFAVLICAILFGWQEFTDTLGGVKSFAGIVALLIMAAIIIGGIHILQDNDYTGRMRARITHLVLGVVVVFALGAIGISWVEMPTGAGLKVLACLAAAAILAAASTAIGYVEDE